VGYRFERCFDELVIAAVASIQARFAQRKVDELTKLGFGFVGRKGFYK
jgi:hypothetical protein